MHGEQIRQEIALSWRRTESSGLDPGTIVSPDDAVEVDPTSRLRCAASPVLDELAGQLAGARYAVVLADQESRLIDIRYGVAALRPALERVGAVLGRQFTEATTGTNSIATAFELRRGVAVHGNEHYLEAFKGFACFGAPIRHPVTRRVAGVLDITCLSADASPLLRPFLMGATAEIEAALMDQASRSHRRLLAAFETASVRTSGPLVAFGADLVLTNDAASDLLEPQDHTTLQALAWDVRHVTGDTRGTLELACGLPVVASVRPVGGGGFLVELQRPDGLVPVPRSSRRAVRSDVDGSVWNVALRADIAQLRDSRTSVVVQGEPGTGRSTVAADLVGGDPVRRLSATTGADLADLGDPAVTTLLIEDAHLVDPLVAARITDIVDASGQRLVITAGPDGVAAGGYASLAARCPVRLELPTLRAHRDRIPLLAAAMLRGRGAGRDRRFSAAALRTLSALDWPGNLRELATVVEFVAAGRSAGDITGDDLPPGYRTAGRQPVVGALWQAERDAIERALRACGGNKVHAAKLLGISRSMLYRRLRNLHIDPDALRERRAGPQVSRMRTVSPLGTGHAGEVPTAIDEGVHG